MTTRHEILRRIDRPDDKVQIVELHHSILVKFLSVSTPTRYSAILTGIARTTDKLVCSVISPENVMIVLRGNEPIADLYRSFDRQWYPLPSRDVHFATETEVQRFNEYFTALVPRQTVSVSLQQILGLI